MNNQEPYRATRLWNEVIEAFQNGMPLKKHRRRMHTYTSCFTATEAATWLHCYLMNNSNFGPDVTRQQTINLLQKFLKCHVIESTVIRSKKKEFADDSHLYRFTAISSQISKPSALCLLQSPAFGDRNRKPEKKKKNVVSTSFSPSFQKENLPECHFVERKLTASEVKLMWEKVTTSRLEKLLPSPSFLEILDEKSIDGLVIKHNVSRLSKTGVVCLMDRTDDIPTWVISAMKCLANWPNASGSGSCLPNYPGFEKDVFKVVRDYFINPQIPLIPASIGNLLVKVFCHFTPCQFNYLNTSAHTTLDLNSSAKSSQLPLASEVMTSTPVGSTDTSRRRQSETRVSEKETSHGQLLLDDPEVMWDYPSVVFYETDFATSSPITRVVSSQGTPSSRSQSCASSIGSIDSVSTISVCSQGYKSDVTKGDLARTTLPLKAWSSNLYLQDRIKEPLQWHKSPLYFSQDEVADSAPDVKDGKESRSLCRYSYEPDVYVCEINDLDTSNLSTKTVVAVEEECENFPKRYSRQELYCSSSAIHSKSSSQMNESSRNYSNQSTVKELVHSEELKSSFQLILLILPSANRRQLHLLMRLLSKVLKNGKFVLNVRTSMRQYLLETFLPAIFHLEHNPKLLLQISAFLLDSCEFLFQSPPGLKQEVEDLSRTCFGRIKYTVDDTCFLTYCEMVSKQKYEEQKVCVSTEALKSLLNSIVQDPNISAKERKRKIKQFKEIHPDVYYLQFPDKEGQLQRPKQTLLNKLVNLRM